MKPSLARLIADGYAPRIDYDHRPPLRECQLPPDGDWRVWLFLGGRGTGKTEAASRYVDRVMRTNPGWRAAIIAPTLGDAVEACVRGPSGIQTQNPDVRLTQAGGGTFVRWPNGSEAKVFGASGPEDVDRLRAGGNRHIVWAEELAAWARLNECWDHMQFGLRLGVRPHVVASTTPKPRKLIVDLVKRADDDDDLTVVRTHGRTEDNPGLSPDSLDEYRKAYAGTRLGRQELDGELLLDMPGALWTTERIEASRVDAVPVALVRVVVAVDPAVTATEESDDTGIVVAALGADGHGYVLDDLSCRLPVKQWATVAVGAYRTRQADRIVAEVNNGGDMVEHLLRTIDPAIAFRKLHASRGKQIRAEPVAALYEQGRVHHVRNPDDPEHLVELEEQLTTWTPEDPDSPDRLDALVWAITELMVDPEPVERVETYRAPVFISDF